MFHFVFHCAANNTYKDKYVAKHTAYVMCGVSSKASMKTSKYIWSFQELTFNVIKLVDSNSYIRNLKTKRKGAMIGIKSLQESLERNE